MITLLDHALQYQRYGFSVIPTNGKESCGRWKPFQTRRPSKTDVQRMFSNGNPTGIAIICGEVSGGLVVRDFDNEDSYLAWQLAHQEFAEILPTVKTARGYHVYFSNCHRKITTFTDGELRGAGYVLAPPSKHPLGTYYEWINPLPNEQLTKIDPFAIGLAKKGEGQERVKEPKSYRVTTSVSHTPYSVSLSDAILKTLPRRPGERNRRLLLFSRALKSIPALADLDSMELQPYVSEWFRQGRQFMSGEHDEADNFKQFCYAWNLTKYPLSDGLFAIALKRLETTPLPEIAKQFRCPKTKRLIHLCRELQHVSGNIPFFLSCRKAGEVIGLGFVAAARRLRELVNEVILEIAEQSTFYKAIRYRYLPPDDGGRQ